MTLWYSLGVAFFAAIGTFLFHRPLLYRLYYTMHTLKYQLIKLGIRHRDRDNEYDPRNRKCTLNQ
ncbi:unnamed protein product [Penicillium manginii]